MTAPAYQPAPVQQSAPKKDAGKQSFPPVVITYDRSGAETKKPGN